MVHWIFGFKYWIISREIPKALKLRDTDELHSSESRY